VNALLEAGEPPAVPVKSLRDQAKVTIKVTNQKPEPGILGDAWFGFFKPLLALEFSR